MANNGSASSSGGIGICGAMFLVFLTLKLCGVITWSWWWVTAPLWIPASIFGVIAVVCLVVFVVVWFLDRVTE